MTPKTIKIGPSKMDLQINYENGTTLVMPSAFLRLFSPSAENKNNQNIGCEFPFAEKEGFTSCILTGNPEQA